MNSAKWILAAAILLLGGMNGASADVVPSDWLLAAGGAGGVPGNSDVQSSGFLTSPDQEALANMLVTSAAGETAAAAGRATIDPILFGNSSVGARARVATGSVTSDEGCLCMSAGGGGLLEAGFENPISGGATVSLMLHVEGSLSLAMGSTPGVCLDCEIVSDMGADVEVVLLAGDLDNLLLLFDGTAVLELAPVLDNEGAPTGDIMPVLTRLDDFETMGTFTFSADGEGGVCTAAKCMVSVGLDLAFNDVQSLGLGDTFAVLLEIFADANQTSAPDRNAESNFYNSASVAVDVVPTATPAPASLLLLVTGLLGLGVTHRRRRFH